ncbi:MAG UNVERIFIED_CONTAM: hypothetical protein LVT10_10055 [Anaerolineae bacterium]
MFPAVVHIDYLSFTNPWSARSYAYEVSQSDYSYMVVLEVVNSPSPTTTLWQQLRRWFGDHATPCSGLACLRRHVEV